MAESIQDLRRERGFLSATEFAAALGVSRSSVSRYDKEPDSISLKVAWAMADLLGCTIDEVVGRRPVAPARGSVQQAYDELSAESRALVTDFVEFCQARDAKAARRRRAAEDARWDRMARFYEGMLYQQEFDGAGFGDDLGFATPEQEREAFRSLVSRKAAEKREADGDPGEGRAERDEEVMAKIMDAYDRMKGAEPQVSVEYGGGGRP